MASSKALLELLQALWFILPAYVSNAAPVIFGGGFPLDLNRKWFDGRPILGKNKTVRGFFSGVVLGTLVGLLQFNLIGNPTPTASFLMSLGAMIGDCTGPFIKRRLGIESGRKAPLLDQYPFLMFAIIFTYLDTPLSLTKIAFLLLITPPIHLLTNKVAYLLGLKSCSW